jgi:hypothetical protein
MLARLAVAGLSLAALFAVALPPFDGLVSVRAIAHTDHVFAAGEPGDPKKPFRVIEIAMTDGPGTMSYSPDKIDVRKGEQRPSGARVLARFLRKQRQAQDRNGEESGDGTRRAEREAPRTQEGGRGPLAFYKGWNVRVRLPHSRTLRNRHEGRHRRQVKRVSRRGNSRK